MFELDRVLLLLFSSFCCFCFCSSSSRLNHHHPSSPLPSPALSSSPRTSSSSSCKLHQRYLQFAESYFNPNSYYTCTKIPSHVHCYMLARSTTVEPRHCKTFLSALYHTCTASQPPPSRPTPTPQPLRKKKQRTKVFQCSRHTLLRR